MCLGWLRRTSTSILPNEFVKQTALNRWIATERRWKGEDVFRGSSVIDEMLWPKAEMKSVLIWLIGSNVTNVKLAFGCRFSCWGCTSRWYAQVRVESISVTVTSQLQQRPSCHIKRVIPSGRLLSGLRMPLIVVLWWIDDGWMDGYLMDGYNFYY